MTNNSKIETIFRSFPSTEMKLLKNISTNLKQETILKKFGLSQNEIGIHICGIITDMILIFGNVGVLIWSALLVGNYNINIVCWIEYID